MKTGNPVQAIVLSVAAIGAIGFLASRLISAGRPSALSKTSVDAASSGEAPTQEGLPTEILRDAFSHPAFQKRLADSKGQVNSIAAPAAEFDSEPLHGPIQTILPPTTIGDRMLLQAAGVGHTTSKPSGNTETDQQEEKTPRMKLGLRAIMRATKPMALISIDGASELVVSPGDQLTANYRVGTFSQNAVRLISPTGSFWLYVGQEVEK